MRTIALLAVLIVAAAALADAASARAPKQLAISGPGGRHYRVVVTQPQDAEDATLKILESGKLQLKIVMPGGLFADDDMKGASANGPNLPPNQVHSRWLYVPSHILGRDDERFMFIFGWPYVPDPAPMYVVMLRRQGAPILAYSDSFYLEAISNSAKQLQLRGWRTTGEGFGKCLTTYNPASVLSLAPDGRFHYSETLSRDYNLARGFPWAGAKPSEKLAVDVCTRPNRLTKAPN